ncbi:hypothetical protein Pint_11925 [Pistacia integerrima]|uniref:Uncharacterized protein n=1 Tax=Pistacia integerrima TaxID=434235 RepID=A0ACC0XI32_9ROSI|nr:hypothetical protein Pint_11925 [Pistacia integerrima]
MADSLPSSIATNILETNLDSPKTWFDRNLSIEILKLKRTVSVVKDLLLDAEKELAQGMHVAETHLAQNRVTDFSKMLNFTADLLHKLASKRPQVCKFILSFIYHLKIKRIRKRLLAMVDTSRAGYHQDRFYTRDWVVRNTLVDTSEVFDRDADKEKVINSLLKTGHLYFSATAIVGEV